LGKRLRLGGRRPFIYVAFAVDDADEVARLGEVIQKCGWDVCYGRAGLPGAVDADAHRDLLTHACCVLVVWSSNAASVAGVRTDTLFGRESGSLVFATLDAAAPPFGGIAAINIEDWAAGGDQAAIRLIVRQIEELAGTGGRAVGKVVPYTAALTRSGGDPRRLRLAWVSALSIVAVAGIAWTLTSTGIPDGFGAGPDVPGDFDEAGREVVAGSRPNETRALTPNSIRGFTTPGDEGVSGNIHNPIDWLEQAAWRDVGQVHDVPAQLDAIANFLVDFPAGSLHEEAQLLEIQQRDALRRIQSELIAKGFLSDLETSSIVRTRMAADRFQRSLGLEPTGLISNGLLVALEAGKRPEGKVEPVRP
jgi:hypothetical protein